MIIHIWRFDSAFHFRKIIIEIKWITLLQYCLLLAKLYSNISCLLTLRFFLELDQKCQFELLKSKHIALRSLLTLKKKKNDFGDNYIEFLESFFFSNTRRLCPFHWFLLLCYLLYYMITLNTLDLATCIIFAMYLYV